MNSYNNANIRLPRMRKAYLESEEFEKYILVRGGGVEMKHRIIELDVSTIFCLWNNLIRTNISPLNLGEVHYANRQYS